MENNEIDKLLKTSFENMESEVNPMIWDNIAKKLDEQPKIIQRKNSSYIWLASAAALLIVCGFSFFLFMQADKKSIDNNYSQAKTYAPKNEENVLVKTSTTAKTKEIIKEPSFVVAPPKKKAKKDSASKIKPSKEPTLIILSSNDSKVASLEKNNNEAKGIILTPTEPLQKTPTIVTKVEPIKPLIVFEEEEESMYANTETPSKSFSSKETKQNIVSTILNTVSENIEISPNKELRFRTDDEGSIFLDVINSLAKNRKKNRK